MKQTFYLNQVDFSFLSHRSIVFPFPPVYCLSRAGHVDMTAIQPSSSLRRQSLATFRGLQNTTFTETGQLRTAKKVACDRCRGQKLRCVWDPRSSKCRRCTRAKAVCIILPPRPMGRPSCGDRNKRDRRDNRNACTRDTQADPAASMLYRNNPPNGYTTVHNEPGVLSDVESGTGTGINPSNAVAVVDPLIPAPMLPSSNPTHLTHRYVSFLLSFFFSPHANRAMLPCKGFTG